MREMTWKREEFLVTDSMWTTGLPGARSEISETIFRKFQDIFVGFTRLKTQKMHVFLSS